MQRILSFHIDEIVIDPVAVGRAINVACSRNHTRYQVSGLCQTYENVIFAMEENNSNHKVKYIIAPFSGTSKSEVEADIYTRWSSGFSTKGLIRLPDSFLGLFESFELAACPDLHALSVNID